MPRPDISPCLIHFTSGESMEAAFQRLRKIVKEKALVGSRRMIKGSFRCVCFSEAPSTSLSAGLLNEGDYSRYSPFGIMVTKKWLFNQGGRPVIYETNSEYDSLPEDHRWRHVLYEIREDYSLSDFTWEREWRIQCDELRFNCTSAKIVVPNREWAERLVAEHDTEEDYSVQQYSVVLGDILAEMYRRSFGWEVITLT